MFERTFGLFCCSRWTQEHRTLHPPEPAVALQNPPAPTSPMDALAAQLDDVMDQARIAAEAQKDIESEAGNPPPSTPRQEAGAAAGAGEEEGEDDDLEDDDENAEASPAAATATQEAPKTASSTSEPTTTSETPAEQVKYSRKDAARFAAELEQRNKDAAEAREIASKAQSELNAMKASDQHILTQLAEVSGFTVEANGRTKYQNLLDKAARGTATEAERTEVAEMTQWHELAKPIYRAAEQQVTNAFATDWKSLKDLPGIGDEGLGKLNKAPNGVAGARELHAMAFAAGQTAAKTEADQTIAKLKAQIKSLRTSSVAGAPQPAVANGAAVPANGTSWKDRAFNADGTLNDDFDKEVRAGKWLGVNLAES